MGYDAFTAEENRTWNLWTCVGYLSDPSNSTRSQAARYLWELGDERTIRPLQEMIDLDRDETHAALTALSKETRWVLMNLLQEGDHPLMRQRSTLYDLGNLVALLAKAPSAPFDLALKLVDEVSATFTCDKCLCKLLFFGAAIADDGGQPETANEYQMRAWGLKGIRGSTPQELRDEVHSYIAAAKTYHLLEE